MSRVKNTARNVFYGNISNFISLALGFISRTIFIQYLSITYLGINGLFTNVLGVLSLAELGFGTAMNYNLYKPVADNDIDKIKSYMQLYKKAYRIIALIVAVIGIIILPFLGYIIKGAEDIDNVRIYYIIFLFNTVSSYFVSYKFSLVNAEQKNYIVTNINTLTSMVTVVVLILVLVLYRNFLIYLLTAALLGLLQKIFISIYLNKMYPYLNEKNVNKLTDKELILTKKNVKALIWHKIGEVSVYQTDSIIISAFVNVAAVGLVSNYNLIITSISKFTDTIFNSAISSLGNLVATESVNKQYYIYKVYRFMVFWIYGFCSVAFFVLLTPFITLWLGEDMVISPFTIFLIVLNFYMLGHRISINNIKTAGGVFNQDKFVALIQAVVNLIVSVIMVRIIGLPGVFLGTVVQGLVSTIIKPIIVYRDVFKVHPKSYFIDSGKFILTVILVGVICSVFKMYILENVSIERFLILMFFVAIIPNVVFILLYRKREEYLYLKNLLLKKRSEIKND